MTQRKCCDGHVHSTSLCIVFPGKRCQIKFRYTLTSLKYLLCVSWIRSEVSGLVKTHKWEQPWRQTSLSVGLVQTKTIASLKMIRFILNMYYSTLPKRADATQHRNLHGGMKHSIKMVTWGWAWINTSSLLSEWMNGSKSCFSDFYSCTKDMCQLVVHSCL